MRKIKEMTQKHKNLFLIIAIGVALLTGNLLYWETIKTISEIDDYTVSYGDAKDYENARDDAFLNQAIRGMEVININNRFKHIGEAINSLP